MVLTDVSFEGKFVFFNLLTNLFFQIFQIHTFFQIYTLVNHIDGNTGHEEWLSGKHRTSPPNVFCKKGVLENFTKFTGKHLCQSLFLIKLQASGVFLGIQVFSYEYYEVFKSSFFVHTLVAVSVSPRSSVEITEKTRFFFGFLIRYLNPLMPGGNKKITHT